MIRARFAVALAAVVSLAALAFGFVAFMTTIRDQDEKPGRLVQTRISNTYTGPPVLFVLDEFFMIKDTQGKMRALYTYPPGFYGHSRGCRVVWAPDEVVPIDGGEAGPGLFVDPCGGARFGPDGRLLAGPADRGLDEFDMGPGVEGFVVDTRTLWCGRLFGVTYPGDPAPTPTATPTSPPTAGPLSPTPAPGSPLQPAATPTLEPTATGTATETPEGTITATPTPDFSRKECDRVTNTSPR